MDEHLNFKNKSALIALLISSISCTSFGMQPNPYPLHQAASDGDLSETKRLLAARAFVDAQDCAGWTPLHVATINQFSDIVTLLLKHNAAVAAQIPEGLHQGSTPLHMAEKKNVVTVLLQNGAPINAKDWNGLTPLHCAAKHTRSKKVVALLLQNDALVDAITNAGQTPMHVAIDCADFEGIIEMFVVYDAPLVAFLNKKSMDMIDMLHDAQFKAELTLPGTQDEHDLVEKMLDEQRRTASAGSANKERQ